MAKEKNYGLEIRRSMESLGVYKKEYEPAILVLADMRRQYDTLTREFENNGYQYAEQTQQGSKKAPIVTTLESLRKDIIAYMNALGLTPRVAGQVAELPNKGAQKKSTLAEALAKLGDSS